MGDVPEATTDFYGVNIAPHDAIKKNHMTSLAHNFAQQTLLLELAIPEPSNKLDSFQSLFEPFFVHKISKFVVHRISIFKYFTFKSFSRIPKSLIRHHDHLLQRLPN